MKIILPVLSEKETNKEFLKEACKGADEAVLVLVIDQDAMAGVFGFATNEIRRGNDLIEELKLKIRKKRIIVDDVVEWGNTAKKIENIIQLKNADKVVLVEQDNDYFRKLVEELKDKVQIPIETIKVEENKEELENDKNRVLETSKGLKKIEVSEEIEVSEKTELLEKRIVSDKKELSENKEQFSIEKIKELLFGKKEKEEN